MRTFLRFSTVFLVLLAFFAIIGYAGIAAGAALMDPLSTATLHDPGAMPLQAVNDASAAFAVSWPFGVLIVTYLAMKLAGEAGSSQGIPALARLGQGRTHVAIAGAAGVAAAAINSLATGAPWTAAIVAALFALSSYWHPAGTASSSSSSSTSTSTPPATQKGSAHLRLMIALAASFGLVLGATSTGCHSATVQSVENAVVDCTKGNSASIVSLVGGLVGALLTYATDGAGNVDTTTLKSEGLGDAFSIGGCLLADAFGKQAAGAAGSDAPKSSPLVIPVAERARVMNALYPGRHFHTVHGDL